jgi:hypothetical protein
MVDARLVLELRSLKGDGLSDAQKKRYRNMRSSGVITIPQANSAAGTIASLTGAKPSPTSFIIISDAPYSGAETI